MRHCPRKTDGIDDGVSMVDGATHQVSCECIHSHRHYVVNERIARMYGDILQGGGHALVVDHYVRRRSKPSSIASTDVDSERNRPLP